MKRLCALLIVIFMFVGCSNTTENAPEQTVSPYSIERIHESTGIKILEDDFGKYDYTVQRQDAMVAEEYLCEADFSFDIVREGEQIYYKGDHYDFLLFLAVSDNQSDILQNLDAMKQDIVLKIKITDFYTIPVWDSIIEDGSYQYIYIEDESFPVIKAACLGIYADDVLLG